jgi:crotonobetainyl-CoA:carnitine CoA-transferase CaiB-like acyl-CoA transferase
MVDPIETPAPWLGEHSVAICRDVLGLEQTEIDALIAKGVVEVTPPPG